MNEADARKQVQALKAFHGHLTVYAITMAALAVVNFMTYLNGAPEIWVIYPLVSWGAFVLMQGIGTYSMGRDKQWQEAKFRELMGWGSSEEELARLARRVDTLLDILATDELDELGPALGAARSELLDAKRVIEHYRSPLDSSDETNLTKQEVVDLVERLELVLTRREFTQLERARSADRAERRAARS